MTAEHHAAGDKTQADQIKKLLQLLKKSQHLGLNLYVGSAYISRKYIDKQNALNAEIDAAIQELDE